MPTDSVLVVGVYLADKPNLAPDITSELAKSRDWRVDQRWVALGRHPVDARMAPVTVAYVADPTPKFTLVNRVVAQAELSGYDYLLVIDDDVTLPAGFVDDYLRLVGQFDLALCQPARTHDSNIDHVFVERLDGLSGRRTRFVEIGPLVSLRRDAFTVLMPFDEASPMGWGYDLTWPSAITAAGLRMGIVDATPVVHSFRKPLTHYNRELVERQMTEHLATHAHLLPDDAFVILESYE
jgi:hypothetical protein